MKIHFIAIGGSAMHSLALALLRKGHEITGSDDAIYGVSKRALEEQGLLPSQTGWFPEKIHEELDAVVLGMHARGDNPELVRAKALGLKIYSYPEFLYELSKTKTRVVIAGSHGKTTITAMVLHVMNYHGKGVDFMLGAPVRGFNQMVNLEDDHDFIVIEGDEYLASALDRRPKFHLYHPNIALISGIAWDHMNVFPEESTYVEQFRIFIDSIVNGGILVYNAEDAILKGLVTQTTNPVRKHPYTTPAYHFEQGHCVLDTPEGEMPLEIFGKHNMSNLSGAKWICQHMGVDEEDFYEAIQDFKGAARRLENIYQQEGLLVYRDFAHSPSKVSATVSAVREQYPDKKLIACLELHTFSSLNREFIGQYKSSLDHADHAVVFYGPEAVSQKKLPELIMEEIPMAFDRKDLQVLTQPSELKSALKGSLSTDSVLLLMSSGDFQGMDLEELWEDK